MKEYFDLQVKERINELNDPEDILCTGVLSLGAYSSSARAQMFTQHLVQSWIPNNPEIPRVSTGYEHMFGEYSGTIKRAEAKLEIIKKIVKHEGYVYTLIVYDPKKNEYDVIQRNEVKNLAESHGYVNDNRVIDSYKENDTIKKGTTLYKSPSTDDYGNFMYGINSKVLYTISSETIEDAVVVSESYAKKFSVTKVDTCVVPINDNDIPLNLYGDKDKYQSFPNIGEKMKHSILCGTRRRDKLYDQYNLKNSNLRKLFSNDSIYQFMGNYKVVDIDLWSNKPIEELSDLPAYSQIKKYFKRINSYWEEVNRELKKVIENDHDATYTQELSRLYAKSRDYLNPTAKYMYDDRMFSNIIMEFTLAKDEPLRRGSKICGRFGNKSVISRILPDKEMGITEDGIIPDIRIDALGVIGRLNSGQCIEQEINWISDKVRKDIIAMGDPNKDKVLDKQIKYLMNYIKKMSNEQYKEFDNAFSDFSRDDLREFIQDIIDGEDIYIHQSPMSSVSGDDLYDLYKTYDMNKVTMLYPNPNGSHSKAMRKVIVADEYIMRLKQEPITKISMRSASLMNPVTLLPIKSLNNKKHKSIFQDQANKIKSVSSKKKFLVV